MATGFPNRIMAGARGIAEWLAPGALPAAIRAVDRVTGGTATAAGNFHGPAPFAARRIPNIHAGGTRLSFERAKELLFANISPPGTRSGTVIAATSRQDPDYYYHWARDGALVMDAVSDFYESASSQESRRRYGDTLKDFAFLTRRHQTMKTPSGDGERKASGQDTPNLSDLGEPKFEVNGEAFTGEWGRPQDDGPALRAVTFIRFARLLLERGETEFVKRVLYRNELPPFSAIKADLEHVSNRWGNTSFDLWEEIRGHHFYTRLSQRRALVEGAKLARNLGDVTAAEWYEKQVPALEAEIERHWNGSKGYLEATRNRDDGIDWKTSGLDVSVILGALHAAGDDGYFSATDERVLATAQRLIETFRALYPINRDDLPGTVIGRYPEDRFDPSVEKSTKGNPWVLATAALGELYWRAAAEFKRTGRIEITGPNEGFFNFALKQAGRNERFSPGQTLVAGTPGFDALLEALTRAGQNQIDRIYYHANPDGSLSEQIHRETGFMHAAPNLTWSYAAFLKLLRAKDVFLKDPKPGIR